MSFYEAYCELFHQHLEYMTDGFTLRIVRPPDTPTFFFSTFSATRIIELIAVCRGENF